MGSERIGGGLGNSEVTRLTRSLAKGFGMAVLCVLYVCAYGH